jgi:Effector Associated Constant Component 1
VTPHQRRETAGPAAVVRIDLRATATGPDAIDAGSFGPDTLDDLQRRALRDRTGENDDEIVDVGRLLVVDDIATVVPHAAVYQHLVVGATTGQLLCVVIGSPSAPAALDLPEAMTSPNSALLWVGDPRGVGWHLGMTSTTRLAVSAADPDGQATLAELVDDLTDQEVFDGVAQAAAGLTEKAGAPAILRSVRWPGPVLSPEAPLPEEPLPAAPVEDTLVRVTGLPRCGDVRSVLTVLWSYGPAVARCERLLAEAESAAGRLSHLPGAGGRRAWQSVTEAGHACDQLASLGPPWPGWPPAPDGPGLLDRLKHPETPTMWPPAAALLPLLACGSALVALVYPLTWVAAALTWVTVLAVASRLRAGLPGPSRRPSPAAAALVAVATAIGAAGGATAAVDANPLGRLGIGQPGADVGSAALGVLILLVMAFSWWRRAVRRWRRSLPFQRVRDALLSLPGDIAGRGVDHLAEVVDTWYRAQWRGLVRRVRRRPAAAPAEPLPKPGPEALSSPEEARAALASAARIIAATVEDEEFLQLNAPDQLPLLDGTPLTARLVKFGPVAAKDMIGPSGTEDEVRWTMTGDRVGVIRLVGLRPGVVQIGGVGDQRSAEVTGTVSIVHGGDQAMNALAGWLLADDELRGRVQPSSGNGTSPENGAGWPSLSVRLPHPAVRTLAGDVTDWLRDSDDPTSVGFTSTAGPPASQPAVTVSAAEVKSAAESETEVILDRIVAALTGP